MPYERKYNYKGTETLLDNVIRIIERDMAEELKELAREYGGEVLPDFEERLIHEKDSPGFPCIVVKPDEDDDAENEDSAGLIAAAQFDITIVERQGADLEQLTRDIVRRKKGVKNVLRSVDKSDLMLGINGGSCVMEIRGGRYTWTKVQNIFGRSVVGMKLIIKYEE